MLVCGQVVENPIVAVQSSDVAAQSAIQYFENMRNFLVAVSEMNLLTFEASDIEKVRSCRSISSTLDWSTLLNDDNSVLPL